MSCDNLILNAEKGKFCFHGEIDGFSISQSELIVALASLKTKAWWNAQIYSATDRVTTLIGTDDSEKTPGEIQEYKPKRGFGTQTNKGSNEYILKYKSTECLRKSMDELNGSEVWALFFTTGNRIQGIRSGQNNLKSVKANISVAYEMVDGVDLIIVKFTFALDFETLYAEVPMEVGFTTDEILGVTGLNLFPVSASLTEMVVDVRDCGNNAVDGLTVGKLTIYDVTAGAVVSSSFVDNSDGTYTGTGTYVSGNIIEARYTGPEEDNLYIQNTTEGIEASA